MIVKGIVEEDFVNYKKPSMFVIFPSCTFKCEKECGQRLCQNSGLIKEKNIEISPYEIIDKYINNPISKALVCGGLEPFDTYSDLWSLIWLFSRQSKDDIVVYTGYTEDEIQLKVCNLKKLSATIDNDIIIKFGRYIPNDKPRFDEILGVDLASKNQYARRL